jgi:hypothetical protein
MTGAVKPIGIGGAVPRTPECRNPTDRGCDYEAFCCYRSR